jgi:DnaK suppressor protein
MSDQELERYRAILLELSSRTRPEINRMRQVVLEDSQAPGEHDRCASESIDKEVILEHNEAAIRRAVMAALERIDDGTFGTCQTCGRTIPQARLAAIPYTAYCVDCERELEEATPK